MELDALSKKVTALVHENGNLKVKECYNQATGGGGGRGNGGVAGMGSASADKKRIEELERTVEALQVEKVVSVTIILVARYHKEVGTRERKIIGDLKQINFPDYIIEGIVR